MPAAETVPCTTCGRDVLVSDGVCSFDGTPLDSATAIAVASTIHPSLRAEPAAERTDPDALTGMRLGKYVVDALIGRGGMGAVYRVTHAELGNKFALKVMDQRIVGSAEGHARFLREARAAARIDHPNVIRVLDHARHPDIGSYLVMELLSGTSLDRIIAERGTLAQDHAVDLALQICDALGAAHEHGVIHRDLKPANVFVTRARGADVVKVMDFGVAKLVADGSTLLTRPGSVIGTPLYMSPEQWDNDTIDARSDVYSFGVVLYEMLTGRVPFRGNGITEVAKNLATMQPPRPRSLRPELSVAIEAVVLRCLEKKRNDRYGSMRDVADALQAARRGAQAEAGAAGAGAGAAPASLRTRNVVMVGAFGAALLAAAAFLVAGRAARDRHPPAAATASERESATQGPTASLTPSASTAVPTPTPPTPPTPPMLAASLDAGAPAADAAVAGVVATPEPSAKRPVPAASANPRPRPTRPATKPRDELFGE